MLTRDALARAGEILAGRRCDGVQAERLPETCRPTGLDSALAIQDEVTRQLGAEVAGWKCLEPPPERLVLAPLYADDIHRAPPVSVWAPQGRARIEPELAFVLGRDLPAREAPYEPDEIDGAVTHTHLVLELIHGRYADPSGVEFPEMLADGLLNQGLFLGPEVDPELADEASELTIAVHTRSAAPQHHKGRHPNTRPRAPLHWLAEFQRRRGRGLKAGDIITTGSYAGVLEVPLEEPVRIQFGELGEISVSFKARVES